MIKKDDVLFQLNKNGYQVKKIQELGGGSNHFVFVATTDKGENLIIKYAKIRETEHLFGENNIDTMFGGELSLEREANLLGQIRSYGLPSPLVRGIHQSPQGKLIVMTMSPGLPLPDYLESCNHSLKSFKSCMSYLGQDFARLHKAYFLSFGDIMDEHTITPGLDNFSDRYRAINDRVLKRCKLKGCLTTNEYKQVDAFFDEKFKYYYDKLSVKNSPPTFVITDMHGGNFFSDEEGRPCGYFDAESSQAAPAEFELYCLRFFVFNFYDSKVFSLVEESFWQGYGHTPDEYSSQLIDFFSACRLLEIFQSYWGVKDGIRDTWGERIKAMLFDYMKTNKVNYMALGDLWRQRDGQPESPLLP